MDSFLGNILYKTLGCWHEDEGPEKVVSLEGTNSVGVDIYDASKNGTARCSETAWERNFKGLWLLYNNYLTIS